MKRTDVRADLRLCADRRTARHLEAERALPADEAGIAGTGLRPSSRPVQATSTIAVTTKASASKTSSRASPRFSDFLERATRFHRVYARDLEYSLQHRPSGLAMEFTEPHGDSGPRHRVMMGRVAKWVSWGRQLCHAGLSPCEARFRWEGPQDRSRFEDYFNCRLEFSQDEDSLLYDDAGLATPLRDHTLEMSQELEQYAQALVEKLSSGEGFVSAVRVAIEDSIVAGSNTESDVARRLAVTPRTLHRRLMQEQTSYRQLRSLILQRHAKALLRQPSISLGEVSYLLGFSEPSTFSRAFKRWTGDTPIEWRLRAM